MRILLIEDDKSVAMAIDRLLTSQGFLCDIASLGASGAELGKQREYDIVVLDLKLPDIDGLDVLHRLRAAKVDTPVLILSGLDSPALKAKALNIGADDYLAKPFDQHEFLARVRAVVRRTRERIEPIVRTGKISVHLDLRVVEVAGRPVHLTDKEFTALELLARRKGKTVRKEAFLEHFYGGIDVRDARIVNVFVCKLRKKLASASGGENYIATEWGQGYLLRDFPPERSTDRSPLRAAA